ncbi:MAG TPA: hypothetical protein VFA07_07860 [Chthonomonadaceae bacterium]|nr:hypothetical protein [Chthonomonadaceae bacterium]
MSRRKVSNAVRGAFLLALGAGLAAGYVYARERRRQWGRLRRLGLAVDRAPRDPQPGDILLFHHARGENRLITLFTRSPFYHAAIYAGEGHAIESRPSGVHCNSLQGRENDFVVVPAPEGKGAEALAWARTQIGAPYDNLDVLVIILEHLFTHLHLNYAPGNKYTCGEFVARAFAEVGVRLVPDQDVEDVVPGDLARHLLPLYEQQAP